MAYSAITNGEIDTDSPITTALMNKIRDNIDAMKDGTGLDNNIIGQDEFKDTIQSATYTGNITGINILRNTFLLTAHGFTIGYAYRGYTSDAAGVYCYCKLGYEQLAGTLSTYSNFENIAEAIRDRRSSGSSTVSIDIDINYVSASPPYNLGDGEIPMFVFAMLDQNGNIIGVHEDKSPPWVYNGPTRAVPDVKINGKKYVKKVALNEESGDFEVELVEITNEVKNADMELIPHPFLGVESGHSVVLIDPVETLYLSDLRDSGERISNLLINDYLRLGSEVQRAGPRAVPKLGFRWRNSRSRAGEMVKDRRLKQGPFADGNRQ